MIKVLKFQADWCSPCKALSKLLEEVETDVIIETVDIDKNPKIAREYGIRGVPTMVMTDDGVEVKRISGCPMKAELEEWLKC